MFGKKTFAALLSAAALISGASTSQAAVTTTNFQSTASLENTGVTFNGSVTYDDVAKLLTFNLKNTSSFQSVITGFYFNIAGDAVASYNAVNNVTSVGVDEAAFADNNSLSPFGTFDAGVALTNLSQQQVRGIDEGETGIFTFDVSGLEAGSLSSIDFLTDKNSGGGISGALAVRYQSVGENAELSDKVFGGAVGGGNPNNPPAVPLPPAAWMGLITLGMIGYKMRQKKLDASIA